MTLTKQEFDQSLEQLSRMYRVLLGLREDVLPRSTSRFGLLAEGPLEEIRRLESVIHEFAGRPEAEAAEAQVWMRIEGTGLAWPEAPTSILTTFLSTLRKGVQAAAEWILTRNLSTRPTKLLKQACDLRVVSLHPGSIQIGLRLPDRQRSAPRDDALDSAVESALTNYLAVAAWAASTEQANTLTQHVSDESLRRILLTEIKRLAPRPRGDVTLVELSGRAVQGRRLSMTREVHARIDQALDSSSLDQTEQYVGELREIDLDDLTFTLRNLRDVSHGAAAALGVACQFDPELLPSAMQALDRRVEIAGVRPARPAITRGSRSSRLRVTRLVILDDVG